MTSQLPPELYVPGGQQALENYSAEQYLALDRPVGPGRLRLWPIRGTKLMGWEMEIYQWAGGQEYQRAPFPAGHALLRDATLDVRGGVEAEPSASLALYVEADSNASMGAPYIPCGVNVFGSFALAIANADAAGYQLWKETSSSDPTLTRLSGYNPAIGILYLAPITIASGTASERLMVGRAGATDILSNLNATPTVDGTLHASLLAVTGMIQTTLQSAPGDAYLLFRAGPFMYRLKSADALGTAPTTVFSALPTEVQARGLMEWGGEIRAFWLEAFTAELYGGGYTAAGGVGFASEKKMHLVHTSQLGDQHNEIEMPLPWIYDAQAYRGGWVIHNGRSLYWMGYPKQRFNLRPFRDLAANSLRTRQIRALKVIEDRIIYRVDEYATSGSVATTSWWMEYNWNLDSHTRISPVQTLTGLTGVQSHMPSGGIPFSQQTRNIYNVTNNKAWSYQYVPPSGESAYSQRGTSGSTGKKYATTGYAKTPYFDFGSPYTNWHKKACEVELGSEGQLDGGTATDAISVMVGGADTSQQRTYAFGDGLYPVNRPVVHRFRHNRTIFYWPTIEVTLNQLGSSAYGTPNALPLKVRGVMGPDRDEVTEYEMPE